MGYLKSVKKTATISFDKIDFKTPTKEAKKIQKEILAFFEKNPDGEVKFEFGGYARLSQPFADALFEGGQLNKYIKKITTWGMHIFDGSILHKATNKYPDSN